jgi:hypothetical protein
MKVVGIQGSWKKKVDQKLLDIFVQVRSGIN